jgi:CBS domain-containing protein
VASQVGSGFGLVLIFLGVFSFMGGAFTSGIWWFLIGIFLRNAARMSYKQLVVRQSLRGETVRRFARGKVHTVPPSLSVAKLVDEYIYEYHYKMFPVAADGAVQGCVTTRQVKEVPRTEWESVTVGEIAEPCSENNAIGPDTDVMEALSLMRRTGNSRLLILEDGRLAGVLTLKDLLEFLHLKLDLEQGEGAAWDREADIEAAVASSGESTQEQE